MKTTTKVIAASIFVVGSTLVGCGILRTSPNDQRSTVPNQTQIDGQGTNNIISPVGNQTNALK